MLLVIFGNTTIFSQPQAIINKLLKDPALKHASWSVVAINVENDHVVASYQPDLFLSPASSMKAITTATALGLLGENYRFKTVLEYDGNIDANGVLKGNIYIKGYGDPTLGCYNFTKNPTLHQLMNIFVKAIKDAGIKKIDGYIVGDASYFEENDAIASGLSWLDLGNWYGAGSWGLNIHENSFSVILKSSSKSGVRPKMLSVSPDIPNLLISNQTITQEKLTEEEAYIEGFPYNNLRFVRGRIPTGDTLKYEVRGSMPDPPFFAAHTLRMYLAKAKIKSTKKAVTFWELRREANYRPQGRKTLYTNFSPDLKTIVSRTNLYSVNLYADCMLKVLGKELLHRGTFRAGYEIVRAYWKKKGVDLEGFVMDDGSGLSRNNFLSTTHLARIMQALAKDPKLYAQFVKTLPLSGVSGTMTNVLGRTSAAGRIRAKTGTMRRIVSYTGFITNRRGELIAFAIMVNNFQVYPHIIKSKMERLMKEIVNS